jgi:DNA-binding NarL/FixJ family response regulator
MDESVKVLIVDDSNIVCERLVKMMADLKGVNIVGLTGSAVGASHLSAKHQPDVITLDLQLADGSGIEVLREVKASRPATSVIVLTNHTGPAFKEMCERHNADFFFDKATELEKVREVLLKLTGRGAALRSFMER